MAVVIEAAAGATAAAAVPIGKRATARDLAAALPSGGIDIAEERYATGAAWLAVASAAPSATPDADENG